MSAYKIKRTDTARAVSQDRYWQPMDTCPMGVKVNLLSIHGVAVAPSAVTPRTVHLYAGWEPLAKVKKHS